MCMPVFLCVCLPFLGRETRKVAGYGQGFQRFQRWGGGQVLVCVWDVTRVSLQGVCEALKVALEYWEEDGSFDRFDGDWEGHVPKGLELVKDEAQKGKPDKQKISAQLKDLVEQVCGCARLCV